MKKYFLLLTILILAIFFTSCNKNTYSKNIWFSNERLAELEITDLPSPTCGDYYHNGKTWVYFNTKKDELKDYAEEVFEYLKTKNFKYLGTRGTIKSSLAGAFTSYHFKEIETFEDCYTQTYSKDYIFVYSNGIVDESGHMIFNEIIVADFDKNTIKVEESDVYYNSKIQVEYDAHYYFESCEEPFHVWEEKTYDLASGIYIRCSVCGKMERIEEK